jgi:hypothetical protein
VLFITAVFLIAPLIIYGYFDEIRQTLNGKLCIALLVTQLFIIFIMPLNEIDENYYLVPVLFHFIGTFASVFVINLMCFDIFLTFRHFREPHYQSNYFKRFVCFLPIFFVVSILLTYIFSPRWMQLDDIFPLMATGILLTFFLTCLMNIFALIASFYYLVVLTRSTTLSENTRFDVERER